MPEDGVLQALYTRALPGYAGIDLNFLENPISLKDSEETARFFFIHPQWAGVRELVKGSPVYLSIRSSTQDQCTISASIVFTLAGD